MQMHRSQQKLVKTWFQKIKTKQTKPTKQMNKQNFRAMNWNLWCLQHFCLLDSVTAPTPRRHPLHHTSAGSLKFSAGHFKGQATRWVLWLLNPEVKMFCFTELLQKICSLTSVWRLMSLSSLTGRRWFLNAGLNASLLNCCTRLVWIVFRCGVQNFQSSACSVWRERSWWKGNWGLWRSERRGTESQQLSTTGIKDAFLCSLQVAQFLCLPF